MARVILFGGTTEGVVLAQFLEEQKIPFLASVATSYGREALAGIPEELVRCGRLDANGMVALLRERQASLVLDATHPYAREASENIRTACTETNIELIRVFREDLVIPDDVQLADSPAHAASLLAGSGARALLTTGSRDLAAFLTVPGYRGKLYVRVLPDPSVVRACTEMGFAGSHLIAMQGPFTRELNAAMLRMVKADVLVTKDGGNAGGLPDKLAAARDAGVQVILIRRPVQEQGISLGQAKALLTRRFGQERTNQPAPRFPLFVSLQDKKVVVVGGGRVSAGRVARLLEFGATVTVVSPALAPELSALDAEGRIHWINRKYTPGDLSGAALAVAATDSREANRQAGGEARDAGIPVSVADCAEECTFWFPAIVKSDILVAGIVSRGGEHGVVRRAAEKMRTYMEGNIQ